MQKRALFENKNILIKKYLIKTYFTLRRDIYLILFARLYCILRAMLISFLSRILLKLYSMPLYVG